MNSIVTAFWIIRVFILSSYILRIVVNMKRVLSKLESHLLKGGIYVNKVIVLIDENLIGDKSEELVTECRI